MAHIIETVGKWGVRTSDFQHRAWRPSPGDPVDVSAFDCYPFLEREWAYIASIDGDRVSVCIGSCSMFLLESGAVSISGGPFCGLDLQDLESTHTLKTIRFWNWGDNCRAAHQGVDYFLQRPVFRLTNYSMVQS